MIDFDETHKLQLRLNEELDSIAKAVLDTLEGRWATLNIVDQFLIELINKSHRTFQSIHLLARAGHIEDALCLLRVLVETSINFGYALKSGPVEAFKRYHDWALVDAVRRRRVIGQWKAGITKTDEQVEKLKQAEEDLKKRRTPEEIDDFKRKGVFGVSLEDRARVAGEERLYNSCYRITSRNSHAIDIIELQKMKEILGEEEFREFFDLRLNHLFSVARYCLGTNIGWANAQFKCGFDERIEALRKADTLPVQL